MLDLVAPRTGEEQGRKPVEREIINNNSYNRKQKTEAIIFFATMVIVKTQKSKVK